MHASDSGNTEIRHIKIIPINETTTHLTGLVRGHECLGGVVPSEV